MPHGKHTPKTVSDINMATMCAYKSSKYALPHWKCVLRCCAKCPCINLPSPEYDQKNSNIIPIIRFNVYHLIERCNVYGIYFLNEKTVSICKFSFDWKVSTKL